MIDTSKESKAKTIAALRHTPGGAFGSARYKLKGLEENRAEYERLIEVFRAHNIGYFFYNGGGDSADTCYKVSQLSKKMKFPVQAIHVPKTVDNDLPITDTCPGFGSVAKYIAVSTREAALDVASMATHVDQGIRARGHGPSCGLDCGSRRTRGTGPRRSTAHHPVPRRYPFEQKAFLKRVEECRTKIRILRRRRQRRRGVCKNGTFLADAGTTDAFGHKQLGGVAQTVAQMVKDKLGLQVPLCDRRLPAALGTPHRLENRCRTGLCGRQSGRRDGPER